MRDPHVFIVSDATGETAYQTLKAAMVQFKDHATITRIGNVRREEQIARVLDQATRDNGLIIHTFASKELRDLLNHAAHQRGVETIDLLGSLMEKLASFFHQSPSAQPGLLHRVDEQYFDRIDAIEYTIRHDDGRAVGEIGAADIILVGISRTSKTPLSVYLAQEGWKVANVPIILGLEPPAKLFEIQERKVVGLTIDSKRLSEVRRARLRRMKVKKSNYADRDYVEEELRHAHSIFRRYPSWPVIDVSGKSIEEISQEVLDALVGKDRRL